VFSLDVFLDSKVDILGKLLLDVLELLLSLLVELDQSGLELRNLGFNVFWSNWWADIDNSELLDNLKVNLEGFGCILSLGLWLLSFLAFATSHYDDIIFLGCCHENLAILELLVDILLVVVIDGFRLNLLGNLLIAWCDKTLLGLELVTEDDKALTGFDLLKFWILSVFDLKLELFFSC
jgi:hypothetical protein